MCKCDGCTGDVQMKHTRLDHYVPLHQYQSGRLFYFQTVPVFAIVGVKLIEGRGP